MGATTASGGTVFGLTLWQILIVVAIGFLVFGVGGSKKLARRAAGRVKDTGTAVKGAANELQASYVAEADPNSAVYRAAQAGRETATQGATKAVEAAKEARDGLAGIADDAKASATGADADPQTTVGRATKAIADSARDVRASVDTDGEHAPETLLGKAAQSVSETAKSRVDMLGETAAEFRAGIEGAPEETPAPDAPALPAGDPPADPAR